MAVLRNYMANLWSTFSTPWLTVEEQARVFVTPIRDKKHAQEFLSTALEDVQTRDRRLTDKRMLQIWTCTAVMLVKKEIQTAKILQDAEKVRKLLASRTKLYRMQQAVIFFMLLFIIGLFCYQVVQVAMNGGNRLDHRIEPLPRIDFRNMLKKKEEQQ
jgi:hypothetical protein